MVKIHGPDGGPNPRPPHGSGTQWAPFTDTTMIETVRGALKILQDETTKLPGCDKYFRALRRSLTFKQVLEDPDVWISFDPTGPDWGVTAGNDITLSKRALALGKWKVAALLVHELAHVAGASDVNDEAENAVPPCGLRDHLIKETDDSSPPDPKVAASEAMLRMRVTGSWRVTIGDWKGFFVFSQDGTCSWRSADSAQLHMGTWKITDAEVQWTFKDEPKDWERLFRVNRPFEQNDYGIDGRVTIKEVPHGFFRMIRQGFP